MMMKGLDVAISGDGNVVKKETEKILKCKDLTIEITAHVKCENRCDTSNNRGCSNYIKIIWKIPAQHIRKV
jgi:hypothetical protein